MDDITFVRSHLVGVGGFFTIDRQLRCTETPRCTIVLQIPSLMPLKMQSPG